MWILSFGASAFGSWAFLDSLNRDTGLAVSQLATGFVVGLALVLFSGFARTPQRVVHWAVLVGLLLAPPALSLFGVTGRGYFFFLDHPAPAGILQVLALVGGTVIWVGLDLRSFKYRLAMNRFVDHELKPCGDKILMRWIRETSLDAPATAIARGTSSTAKIGFSTKWIGMIVPLSVIGYAASRWLGSLGGSRLVLLVLAFLCIPIVLVILSKLACGAYLNLVLVRRLEASTGKPVLFDQIPRE